MKFRVTAASSVDLTIDLPDGLASIDEGVMESLDRDLVVRLLENVSIMEVEHEG